MEYSPLNPDQNEIRLLTLLPDDDNNGLVGCILDHVSLINPPEFAALSYCWGDPAITNPIAINDIAVPVTINLESALRHLRAKGYTRLWVDAICINQTDKVEKSQQLLWMGSIYQRAREVAAWVGEELDDTMGLLVSVPGETDLREATLSTVFRFFERPYWRRVWVIQELALARRTVVHCGKSNADWPRISNLVERYGRLFRQKLGPAYSRCGVSYMEKLLSFHQHTSMFKPLSFLEALLRSSGSLSTDPRDKVFALLGLVHDSRLYIPVPNYRQSVDDVCLSMTLSAIATTSRLEIIPILGSGCDKTATLASWIPNWVSIEQMSERHIKQLTGYLSIPQNEVKSQHQHDVKNSIFGMASQNSGSSLPKIVVTGTTLAIKALILDEVDGLTLSISETGDLSGSQPLQSQSSYSSNPYIDNSQRISIVLETLLQYPLSPNKFPLATEPLSFLFTKPILLATKLNEPEQNWLLASRNLMLNGSSLLETSLGCEGKYGETFQGYRSGYCSHSGLLSVAVRKDEDEMFGALQSQLNKNMRFMTTKRGYVGWVHARAHQGDVIAVFETCEVLVVLRPRPEGGYLIVGDAYIEKAPGMFPATDVQPWVEIQIF